MVPPAADLRVRSACPEDADTLSRMARALSRQQGEPDHRFLPEAVVRDLFGPDACSTALLAERGADALGYALYCDSYDSAWAARGVYLSDLWVEPAARRQGVGRALLAAVAADARRRRRVYLWWASKPWNEDAHAFYRALGAGSEPVLAHALVFDAFRALAADGDR